MKYLITLLFSLALFSCSTESNPVIAGSGEVPVTEDSTSYAIELGALGIYNECDVGLMDTVQGMPLYYTIENDTAHTDVSLSLCSDEKAHDGVMLEIVSELYGAEVKDTSYFDINTNVTDNNLWFRATNTAVSPITIKYLRVWLYADSEWDSVDIYLK